MLISANLVINYLSVMIFALLAVAFFSLFERKLLSLIQSRLGPNKVSVIGLLQPIADAMKLLTKVELYPSSSFLGVYFLSPLYVFFISMVVWILYPLFFSGMNLSTSGILVLIYFSLSVYGLIMSGWFSNSKYTLIGSVRAISQSISYEIGLTSVIMIILISMSSMSLICFKGLQSTSFLSMFHLLVVFLFVILLSETNRSPFDLAEGESELVSGYSVEYGGLSYTLIFLGENLSILWSSILISSFFCWELMTPLVWLFVWIRGTFPRIRFDKMMLMFWLTVLPLLLGVGSIFMSFL